MMAKGNTTSPARRLDSKEIDRLFERAAAAPGSEKVVTEFLNSFSKDYQAQVKQRKKDEGK